MSKQKRTWDVILVVVMVLLCLLWIYPIVLILLNSLKTEGSFTTSTVFRLPTAETFAGLRNYVYGVTKMDFLSSMGYSLLITITSVVLILLCCSMTGWYLTRVNNKLSKFMNLLIVFSMVVPFQMVMFTLSKTADRLNLNNPWNICIIYLGFGAGLAVFMFTGFMKSVPMAIQYFRGGYGRVELAPMMACIIIAIIPIIILYMTCQKYIIEGVVAGAVKG